MKELILFSFIVLFIACQNQPLPNFESKYPTAETVEKTPAIAAIDTPACTTASEEILDLTKELENPESPGIHYRKTVLTSELTESFNQAEFICVSKVTHSTEPEMKTAELKVEVTEQPMIVETSAETESWDALTGKWAVVPETVTCLDKNRFSENPMCENAFFFAEEGKLFSSRLVPAGDTL